MSLSPEEELQKEKNNKMTTFISAGCLVIIISLVGFFAMAYYFDRSRETPVGTEVTLHSNTAEVPVFSDRDALVACQKTTESSTTAKSLVAQDRVVMVESGTRARVDISGHDYCRIEILEGEHTGRIVYVERTSISHNGLK